jgi:hypothetical protein
MHQNLTLYQFNSLTEPERYWHIENKGVFLEVSRPEGIYRVALFELYGFYVEVWLNQKTDRINKTNSFKTTKRLDLYLSGIDLTAIYNLL